MRTWPCFQLNEQILLSNMLWWGNIKRYDAKKDDV